MSATIDVIEKPAVRRLRFTQHRDFQKTLNERVNAYLRENHIPGRDVPAMYLKTAFALAWWLGDLPALAARPFLRRRSTSSCAWCGRMAIASVGFNVMHDANHGGYSNHPLRQQAVQPQRRNAGDERVPLAHQAQRVAPHLHQHRRLR